jgi:activator of 2-hydroxyglutaryl-CoA dehydratase
MAKVVQEKLGAQVNVPEGDMVQYVAALGAALLAQHRLRKLSEQGAQAESEKQLA